MSPHIIYNNHDTNNINDDNTHNMNHKHKHNHDIIIDNSGPISAKPIRPRPKRVPGVSIQRGRPSYMFLTHQQFRKTFYTFRPIILINDNHE